jgi:hypothetical protein
MDESNRLLVVEHLQAVVPRPYCRREGVYGRQHPRSRTRKDHRSHAYDKVGRQSYREWARRRTKHPHARKSAAGRERIRIMHAFFFDYR